MKITILFLSLISIVSFCKAQFLIKNSLKTGVDYQISEKTYFSEEGFKLIEKNKKFGFLKFKKDSKIDYEIEDGNIILPQFEEAEVFYNGWTIVKQNGKYGVIDTNGVLILPLIFEKAVRSETSYTSEANLELKGEKMTYNFKSKEMLVNNKLKELELKIAKENEDNQKIKYEMSKMYDSYTLGSADQKKWEPIINIYTEIVNYNALVNKQARHYVYKNGMLKINKYTPAPDLLEELKQREGIEKPALKIKINSLLNAFTKDSDEYKQLSKKINELYNLETEFNTEKLSLKL